ncbi:hypothetical protein Tco_0878230 [Tanacetum coccineum]|uniref:Uncharacterized protein n=1 Tax=Tanacetum coccineum TaxID=301880 RepID=A0ABQ5C372_9ASTR
MWDGGKQNEHVTRPSTVNPPSNDEKVNAEMAIQIMVEVVALGEMQAIKVGYEKLKAVAALKPLQEKLEEEFSMEIDRKSKTELERNKLKDLEFNEGSKSSQAYVKPINPPPVQKKPAPYKPRHAKVTAAKETEYQLSTNHHSCFNGTRGDSCAARKKIDKDKADRREELDRLEELGLLDRKGKYQVAHAPPPKAPRINLRNKFDLLLLGNEKAMGR